MLGDRPVRALQIFLRPNARDLEPMVQFHEFSEEDSLNRWRLVAGPSAAPLKVRSDVCVFDAHMTEGVQLRLPAEETGRNTSLYVYRGKVAIAGEVISEGESVFSTAAYDNLTAWADSDVLLFSMDPAAKVYRGGMFSGNQRCRT